MSETHRLSLQSYRLVRPEKVRWIFDAPPSGDILSAFPSKSLRKFLARSDEAAAQHGVRRVFTRITPEIYAQWLAFYEKRSRELQHEILATPEWWQVRTSAGAAVLGHLYYQGDTLVGGSIITETADTISLAYKASESLELGNLGNSNLGSLIEYDFLRYAQNRGKRITSGLSRNAFGQLNSLGYLALKLRFGYTATIPDNATLLDSVPVAPKTSVLFYAIQREHSETGQLLPYFLMTDPEQESLISEIRYKLPGLTLLEHAET